MTDKPQAVELVDDISSAVKRLRLAMLDLEYAESVFRLREQVAVWVALWKLKRVTKRLEAGVKVEVIEKGATEK